MTKTKQTKKTAPLNIYEDRQLTAKPKREQLYVRIELEKSEALRQMSDLLQQPLYKLVELAIDLLHEDYQKRTGKKR